MRPWILPWLTSTNQWCNKNARIVTLSWTFHAESWNQGGIILIWKWSFYLQRLKVNIPWLKLDLDFLSFFTTFNLLRNPFALQACSTVVHFLSGSSVYINLHKANKCKWMERKALRRKLSLSLWVKIRMDANEALDSPTRPTWHAPASLRLWEESNNRNWDSPFILLLPNLETNGKDEIKC